MDIRIIKRLHELLITEQSGIPKELASKLGISERTVYNYFSFMKKEMKAELEFNKLKNTYCYVVESNFHFKLK